MDQSTRQLLTGDVIVTMNAAGEVFSPGVVVTEGTRILHVGAESSWAPHGGETVVDCRGCLIMPGLVNVHTHACMTLFRGLGEERSRQQWFAASYAPPYMERAVPADYYWGTMLGGLEMLTNGITCTADRFSHMALIAEAFDRLGMRAVLCHTLRDINAATEWEEALALVHRWGTSPQARIHCGIGPHAPDTCSDDLLRQVRRVAGETGGRIFIHCAQSEAEVTALRARGHAGAVRCLAAAGLLGPDLVAAHCIYVDEEELRQLADTGTWVAHCPVSNARIEGRMPPVAQMLRRGVRMALGTDWAVSNNTMDLFDEMKCAGVLNKVAAGDPAVLPSAALLRMATVDGARALGLETHTGSLEPGKAADVIALTMEGLHLEPWHDIPAALVYSAKGRDVRHVWVDGRQLVRDGRPTHVDVGALREEIGHILLRIMGPTLPSGGRRC